MHGLSQVLAYLASSLQRHRGPPVIMPPPGNPNNPSHFGSTLALVAWYTSTLLASPDRGPGPPNGPPLSGAVQWLGAFLLAYLVVLIGLRAREDGSVALLDIGWACNLAIGASGCALWQGHSSAPVVVAAFMLLVATDHVMWCV